MYQKNEMRVTMCNAKGFRSKSYIVSITVRIILNRFVENGIVKTCCVISSYIYSSKRKLCFSVKSLPRQYTWCPELQRFSVLFVDVDTRHTAKHGIHDYSQQQKNLKNEIFPKILYKRYYSGLFVRSCLIR